MYIPNSFAERDLPTLHAYIEAHPLGALVSQSAGEGLYATHLPLVLDRAAGESGTLLGHLARANPHARLLPSGAEVLVIFSGPDTYITPEWYATKRETGKVVPTWNYVAVHAYGTLRTHADPAWLRSHLEALTARHEGARGTGWQVTDAPADYLEQQLKAIMGVEIVITRLEGKWKMSQNRPDADIAGVIDGLRATGTARDADVAGLVEERRPEVK